MINIYTNLAQKLLKNRSLNTEGVVSTLFQSKDNHQKIHRGLQIIFCHSNHWIIYTASNMNDENEIMIYDSMYTSVDDEVRETISKLFYCTDDPHVSLAPMQKQLRCSIQQLWGLCNSSYNCYC